MKFRSFVFIPFLFLIGGIIYNGGCLVSYLHAIAVQDINELQSAIDQANNGTETLIEFSTALITNGSENLHPLNAATGPAPASGEFSTDPFYDRTFTINGNGNTFDGSGTRRGFFVLGKGRATGTLVGSITITNLTISNMRARGGNGGDGEGSGGGGAGFGGGLFVADGANVTVSNVTFMNCEAEGGTGGSINAGPAGGGGGGGMQGNGSQGETQAAGGGGGFYGNAFATLGFTSAGGGGSDRNAGGQPGGGDFNGANGGSSGGGNGGPGGGGGGVNNTVGGNGGAGGFGGGGGGGFAINPTANGDGGAGGFGGGGGGSDTFGAATVGGLGGFGGGGGGNPTGNGGNGGFGGGGGDGGTGGFGGGDNGGGGAGFGGAIFIQTGGNLTIEQFISLAANSTTGGTGGLGGTNGTPLGDDIFMMSGGQITVQNLITDSIVPSPIEGDGGSAGGGLTLGNGNTAIFTISGVNTYTGTTAVNSGTLRIDTGSIATDTTVNTGGRLQIGNNDPLGAQSLTLNGGELEALSSLSFSSPISIFNSSVVSTAGAAMMTVSSGVSGSGGLSKEGSGTLLLTVANTYSGGTTVTNGLLQVTGSLNTTGSVTVNGGTLQLATGQMIGRLQGTGGTLQTDAGTLIVNQDRNQSFAGVIDGAGNFTKTGSAALTLTGVSTLTGDTVIDNGMLVVNAPGVLPASGNAIQVNANGALSGTGQVGDLNNDGLVLPASSGTIGTLTVNGEYSQTNDGILFINIANDSSSDLLDVNLDANLDGTLEWQANKGVYRRGTQFTVLTAGGSFNGTQFSDVVEEHPFVDFIVNYVGSSVIIEVTSGGPVLPVSLNDLSGNARHVADYLFSCGVLPPNEDLVNVIDNLAQLPADEFIATLSKLSPVQMRALPLTMARNDTQIASLASVRYDSCICRKENYFWITPLISYYDQKRREREIGFATHGRGVSVGQIWFFNGINCGAHADYLYSKLNWNENVGMAQIHAIYLSPFVGYVTDLWHVNLALLGAYAFYDVDRTIHFSSIQRTAHHNHKSWDGLVRIEGGTKVEVPSQKNLFLAPEATVNYLNIWESNYQETGADSINLVVQRKHSAFLNPKAVLKCIKEFPGIDRCFSFAFRVGWQSFIPLSNGRYDEVSFLNQQTCQPFFFVEGLTTSTHQLVLGGKFALLYCDDISFHVDYEASLFDGTAVHQGFFSIFWKW